MTVFVHKKNLQELYIDRTVANSRRSITTQIHLNACSITSEPCCISLCLSDQLPSFVKQADMLLNKEASLMIRFSHRIKRRDKAALTYASPNLVRNG